MVEKSCKNYPEKTRILDSGIQPTYSIAAGKAVEQLCRSRSTAGTFRPCDARVRAINTANHQSVKSEYRASVTFNKSSGAKFSCIPLTPALI
jgi:hypothetical protein